MPTRKNEPKFHIPTALTVQRSPNYSWSKGSPSFEKKKKSDHLHIWAKNQDNRLGQKFGTRPLLVPTLTYIWEDGHAHLFTSSEGKDVTKAFTSIEPTQVQIVNGLPVLQGRSSKTQNIYSVSQYNLDIAYLSSTKYLSRFFFSEAWCIPAML